MPGRPDAGLIAIQQVGSAMFAAVATTVWIIFVLLSIPRWAFMPNYHWLPFLV
jgi:hypothetical protein